LDISDRVVKLTSGKRRHCRRIGSGLSGLRFRFEQPAIETAGLLRPACINLRSREEL
jgi:hypothetical protein